MECVKLRKMAKGLAEVLTRVAILGMSAQILLGLFWILTHFSTFPNYEESLFLLKVQESLGFDEYTGILYPLLMRLLSMVAGAFSMPFYCLIYMIQLGVAAWAVFFFVTGLGGMKKTAGWFRVLIALTLLTMPVAVQCHLAVLPYSLAGSFFLMQLGMLLRAVRRVEQTELLLHEAKEEPAEQSLRVAKEEPSGLLPDKKEESAGQKKEKAWHGWKRPAWNLVRMGLAWTLQVFLLPEYYLFGGLLLVFYGLWESFGKREDKEVSAKEEVARALPILLLTAIFLSLIPCIMKMTVKEGAYQRMYPTAEGAAVRRIAWENFEKLQSYFPKELEESLSASDVEEIQKYPEQMIWILGRAVDASRGKKEARRIYGEFARAVFRNYYGKTVKETVKDAIAYELSPAYYLLALSGKGHYTQLPKNHEIMRHGTPLLTTIFVSFGGWCFLGILLLGACLQTATLTSRQGKERWLAIRELIAVFLTGMAMVAYYSLWAGGAMDDKKTYVIALLWVAAAGNAIANNIRFEQKEKKAGE